MFDILDGKTIDFIQKNGARLLHIANNYNEEFQDLIIED